jgi:hypothetical protein
MTSSKYIVLGGGMVAGYAAKELASRGLGRDERDPAWLGPEQTRSLERGRLLAFPRMEQAESDSGWTEGATVTANHEPEPLAYLKEESL